MSSDETSDSSVSSSSNQSLDEFHINILEGGAIAGYQFEPRRDPSGGESNSEGEENSMAIDEQPVNVRLDNLDWYVYLFANRINCS